MQTVRSEIWVLGRRGPPRWMLRAAFVFVLLRVMDSAFVFGQGVFGSRGSETGITLLLTAPFLGALLLALLVLRLLYRRWWKCPGTPDSD